MEKTILLTETVKYYGKEISIEKLGKQSDKKIQVQYPVCNKKRWVFVKIYFATKNTICHKCGLKFHKIYGRNNINREQLNEFLST